MQVGLKGVVPSLVSAAVMKTNDLLSAVREKVNTMAHLQATQLESPGVACEGVKVLRLDVATVTFLFREEELARGGSDTSVAAYGVSSPW